MNFLYLVAGAIVFILLVLVYWYATIPKNLPPGPIGLPLIGSVAETWKTKPYDLLVKWSKQYGPVYKFYIGPRLIVVLANWETINDAITKQPRAYGARDPLRTVMPTEITATENLEGYNTEHKYWAEHRPFIWSSLQELTTSRPVIDTLIAEDIQNLLNEIGQHNGKPFDIGSMLARIVTSFIVALIFGKRFPYHDKRLIQMFKTAYQILKWSEDFLSPAILCARFSPIAMLLPKGQQKKKLHTAYMNFVHEESALALERYRDGDDANNFVTLYKKTMLSKNSSQFTLRQLHALMAKMVLGGTVSTVSNLSRTLRYVTQNPGLQEKIYDEIKQQTNDQGILRYADRNKMPLTNGAILEALRLPDRGVIGFRRTIAPSKINGYDIPSDAVVILMMSNAFRDPAYFPEPNAFDPYRYISKDGDDGPRVMPLPFGAGKRNCIGEPLARLELFMFFTAILLKYRIYAPPKGAVVESTDETLYQSILCAVPRED